MNERDLGSVARAMKHAFAEKRASEADAVQTADQFAVLIYLDRVAIAALIKLRGRGSEFVR